MFTLCRRWVGKAPDSGIPTIAKGMVEILFQKWKLSESPHTLL